MSETIYKFRFGTSNKLIQSHLDRIPYLQALVTQKDDLSSIQNEQDEYVLSPPIHFNWFMAIAHAISTEQTYTLFTELSENDNISDALQLFDYLGIKSFSSPLLNEPKIVLTNPMKNEYGRTHVEYHRVKKLSEARNIAAQFVIPLTKNEYDLHDFETIECIFSLISILCSDGRVFNSRFRHHTFTLVEEYVFPLFYIKNSVQLLVAIEQPNAIKSEIYVRDDAEPLPEDFGNAFSWKGSFRLTEAQYGIDITTWPRVTIWECKIIGKSDIIKALWGRMENNLSTEPSWSNFSVDIIDTPGLFDTNLLNLDPVISELDRYE